MDGQQATMTRDASGRFAPGCSGNPAGKRKGTRNRATLLAEALRDGEGEAMARTIIDKALAGDAVAARFCLALLSPRPKGRAITLDLPAGGRPGDVVTAFNVTLAAMAAGEITPDEALVITKVLDFRLRALKAWQLEENLTAHDRVVPGDEAMLEEDAADEAPADQPGSEADAERPEVEHTASADPETLVAAPPPPHRTRTGARPQLDGLCHAIAARRRTAAERAGAPPAEPMEDGLFRAPPPASHLHFSSAA